MNISRGHSITAFMTEVLDKVIAQDPQQDYEPTDVQVRQRVILLMEQKSDTLSLTTEDGGQVSTTVRDVLQGSLLAPFIPGHWGKSIDHWLDCLVRRRFIGIRSMQQRKSKQEVVGAQDSNIEQPQQAAKREQVSPPFSGYFNPGFKTAGAHGHGGHSMRPSSTDGFRGPAYGVQRNEQSMPAGFSGAIASRPVLGVGFGYADPSDDVFRPQAKGPQSFSGNPLLAPEQDHSTAERYFSSQATGGRELFDQYAAEAEEYPYQELWLERFQDPAHLDDHWSRSSYRIAESVQVGAEEERRVMVL